MLKNPVIDLLVSLDGAEDASAIWQHTERFLLSNGFSHSIYTYVNRDDPAGTHLWTSLPVTWQHRYIEQEFHKIDPFFKYCCGTFQPVKTGPAFIDDYAFLNSAERQVIQEGGETGFVSGISSPVRLVGGGAFGGWNFGTSMHRREFEVYMADKSDSIRLAGFIIHEHLQRVSTHRNADAGGKTLTHRERECLLWLARGLRTGAIADRLGIAAVTVDLHIKGARMKLHAATREEALVKAILSGQIVP